MRAPGVRAAWQGSVTASEFKPKPLHLASSEPSRGNADSEQAARQDALKRSGFIRDVRHYDPVHAKPFCGQVGVHYFNPGLSSSESAKQYVARRDPGKPVEPGTALMGKETGFTKGTSTQKCFLPAAALDDSKMSGMARKRLQRNDPAQYLTLAEGLGSTTKAVYKPIGPQGDAKPTARGSADSGYIANTTGWVPKATTAVDAAQFRTTYGMRHSDRRNHQYREVDGPVLPAPPSMYQRGTALHSLGRVGEQLQDLQGVHPQIVRHRLRDPYMVDTKHAHKQRRA